MSFSGKIVLVTGAGSGIGTAIAMLLAERGATVAVTDVDETAAARVASEIAARGGAARPYRLDVSNLDGVRSAVAAVHAAHGAIDALVNNAGWDKAEPFLESTPETWDRLMRVNFLGPIHLTHAVLPIMIAAGHGRIVNIASDAGRVGSSGEVVYSATKGGVIAFTKAIAREVARQGIAVNCIAPGPTDTPFFAALAADQPKLGDALKRAIPLGRLAEPIDIARAVAFLASEEAAYITGQTLSVSGGLTMI